jgi:hypothetical protein
LTIFTADEILYRDEFIDSQLKYRIYFFDGLVDISSVKIGNCLTWLFPYECKNLQWVSIEGWDKLKAFA